MSHDHDRERLRLQRSSTDLDAVEPG